MKEYPSISHFSEDLLGRSCIAFLKYDGSNIRVKWSPKKGWHLFGTRHRLFDHTDPEYGCAIDIWHKKYAADIDKIIHKEKAFNGAKEVICYCEFFGPNSFAGQHDIKHPALLGVSHNDPKDLILFDVNIHKKGLMSPSDFVNTFSDVPIAKIIHQGMLEEDFVNDIREGKYSVMEGIVCKGGSGHKLWMAKIKTFAYLKELKTRFAGDWEKYV
jgi:hypothetical protein